MTASEDLADVDRVLGGDIAAFEALVRRWQGPLVNLAYRFCRDRGRAEELAQEAFLRAYRNLAQWRRDAAFSTWLFAIATNVFRTELRRFPPAALALDRVPEPAATGRPSDALDMIDRGRALRRAVDLLPPKYREALIVFYFQGMDLSSAASTLGVPEGTLKARLARGRDLLRRKLGKDALMTRISEA